MPDGYWANFLSVLFVGRAPDDLRRQYRLPPGRRKGAANGSAPSTNHCRVISLCSIVPAPHNASLQANLPAGVRSRFHLRTDSKAREAALADSGPICADKTTSAAHDRSPRSVVCSPQQPTPVCKSPPPSGSAPGRHSSPTMMKRSSGEVQWAVPFMTQ